MSDPEKDSAVAVLSEKKLLDLARKRLERFASLLPKTLIDDHPDNVHDLRVWSRRLQQVFKVLLPERPTGKSRKLIRIPRKIRRALGDCRNLDVCIDLIQKKIAATNSEIVRNAWRQIQSDLREQREAELEECREKLRQHDIIDFVTRAQACLKSSDLQKAFAQTLKDRVEEARTRWHETLAEAHENPTTDQIHALRIAGKRLRYRAELLADLGHAPAKSLVKSLKVLQNELGYWNDSQVLLRFMAKSIGHADFLLGHPDYARALITEMEKERQRNDSATVGILKSAEKVREWRFPEEASEQEPA
jgi:CHAD domain-containing protein